MVKHYTKSLPYELELTSRILHEAAVCFFKENNFEISHDEFVILDCLYMYPDIIQIELAKMILKGRAHTGRFLMGLEEKGLIKRTPTKQNTKLIMKLTITQKGLEIYNKIGKAIDTHVENLRLEENFEKINEVIKLLRSIREDVSKTYTIKFD